MRPARDRASASVVPAVQDVLAVLGRPVTVMLVGAGGIDAEGECGRRAGPNAPYFSQAAGYRPDQRERGPLAAALGGMRTWRFGVPWP